MDDDNRLPEPVGLSDVTRCVPLAVVLVVLVEESDENIRLCDPDAGSEVVDPTTQVVLYPGVELCANLILRDPADVRPDVVAFAVIFTRPLKVMLNPLLSAICLTWSRQSPWMCPVRNAVICVSAMDYLLS